MCSFVLTASPEFFKVATPDKQQRFFRDFTNFFKNKYGEENVLSAIVHLDETNPHMHLTSLARVLLPAIREYLLSEQGKKDYAQWTENKQKQLNKTKKSQ